MIIYFIQVAAYIESQREKMNIIVISLKEEFYSHADALVKFKSFNLLVFWSLTLAVYPHLGRFYRETKFLHLKYINST